MWVQFLSQSSFIQYICTCISIHSQIFTCIGMQQLVHGMPACITYSYIYVCSYNNIVLSIWSEEQMHASIAPCNSNCMYVHAYPSYICVTGFVKAHIFYCLINKTHQGITLICVCYGKPLWTNIRILYIYIDLYNYILAGYI